LHRAENVPIKAIARQLGIARNTVRAALASDTPPKYQRAGKQSLVDAAEPEVRKLLMIDGGFSKAYHSETGIAGYTLIYNSHGLQLVQHEPFESAVKAVEEGKDIISTKVIVEATTDRITVRDTTIGKELQVQIDDLKNLLAAYRSGQIKERK
jgi:fructose-1,6-bisphosphatase